MAKREWNWVDVTQINGWKYAAPIRVDTPDGCEWYHTMDLPIFGTQLGDWDLRGCWREYSGGIDVRGKSVLDVGLGSGWVSFEAERHGARDVLAFEGDDAGRFQRVPHLNCPPGERPDAFRDALYRSKRGFWLAHRLYDSQVKAVYGDIYELGKHVAGAEISIVGQILVHVRDPLGALLQFARATTETLVIVEGSFEAEAPLAVFVGGSEGAENHYSWFHLSTGLYRAYLAILGFEVVSLNRNKYRCVTAGRDDEVWTITAQRVGPTDGTA